MIQALRVLARVTAAPAIAIALMLSMSGAQAHAQTLSCDQLSRISAEVAVDRLSVEDFGRWANCPDRTTTQTPTPPTDEELSSADRQFIERLKSKKMLDCMLWQVRCGSQAGFVLLPSGRMHFLVLP